MNRVWWWGAVSVLLAGILWVMPPLQAKVSAQRMDKTVAMALDWEDVAVFGVDLKSVPSSVVVFSHSGSQQQEDFIRRSGQRLLWRLDDAVRPGEWLPRFQSGDGIFIAGDHVLEHPGLIRNLPKSISDGNGFLVLMEFLPNALLPHLATKVDRYLIKGHILATREIMNPRPSLMKKRLLRSVKERWVRLLVVRFSPAWSLEQNLEFQRTVADELSRQGFRVEGPRPFQIWKGGSFSRLRLNAVLLISVLIPVLLSIWGARAKWPVSVVFPAMCATSLLAGILIHGLGSFPHVVMGINSLRGVKLQLLLPLLTIFFFMFSPLEWKKWLDSPIRMKDVVVFGGGLLVILSFYLMRSGNFSLIPVSDSERGVRDILDTLLVARPRLKEFFIGHPLLLAGLTLIRTRGAHHKWGRILMGAGMVGQISILNTFSHFAGTLDGAILRTFNGVWLGIVVATPVLLLCRSRK